MLSGAAGAISLPLRGDPNENEIRSCDAPATADESASHAPHPRFWRFHTLIVDGQTVLLIRHDLRIHNVRFRSGFRFGFPLAFAYNNITVGLAAIDRLTVSPSGITSVGT